MEQPLFKGGRWGDDLSDHCPIGWVFETDDTIDTSDAITVLLDRLDAVQAELEEIRAGPSPPCGSRRLRAAWSSADLART